MLQNQTTTASPNEAYMKSAFEELKKSKDRLFSQFKAGEVSETFNENYTEIVDRIKLGRKTLESCLPMKTLVFVAPWNKVSKQAWRALRQEGFAVSR